MVYRTRTLSEILKMNHCTGVRIISTTLSTLTENHIFWVRFTSAMRRGCNISTISWTFMRKTYSCKRVKHKPSIR